MCNTPHHCKQHHGHSHGHGSILPGKNTELIFSLLCGLMLAVGFGFSFTAISPTIPLLFYIISLLFGGFFTTTEAFQKIVHFRFEIDFLMVVAALGAVYLGKWAEGALLLFLFSLGHALEHYALNKAQKSISELGKLRPKTALRKEGEEIREVSVNELKINDIVIVKPNEQISADGVVISGHSSVNQAPITGESIPVDKEAMLNYSSQKMENLDKRNRVYAGTINGENTLEIKVLRTANQSTLARMVQLVTEAQTKQSPTQRLTQKIERIYVPIVLILVIFLCFFFLLGTETFQESLYRAMSVLVASSPCALAISTPGTVLSGIGRAAQKGVLIKGGSPLENLGSVKALAFDKTGTLTEGKPEVVEIITTQHITKENLLNIAAGIEKYSTHPLAQAVVSHAQKLQVPIASIMHENIAVVSGKGIAATWKNKKIRIGKLDFIDASLPESLEGRLQDWEQKGYSIIGISQNSTFLGMIALLDQVKTGAKQALAALRALDIEKIIMLTGDRQAVANSVGNILQISESYGNLLPEEKVFAIKELNSQYNHTAMIGDGVNDAPAMITSSVSVAMGTAGSDVALETADVALLSDDLSKLPFAVGLSRKARQIIKQNLYISLGSIAVLIPLAILGITGIGATVFLHEGTTIIVILNALRLLTYK